MQATRTAADIRSSPSDEEFLARFGDPIDDHVAEILDELLEERDTSPRHRRLPRALGAVTLVLALTASCAMLRIRRPSR